MKNWKIIVIAFVAVIGVWLLGYFEGREHFRDATKMLGSDTVYVFDTVRYTKAELAMQTTKLDVPKVSAPEYVWVVGDSASVVYRDSIRYVMLPREFYYTRTHDAEIWHSGVGSTIDSLNVFQSSTIITKTQTIVKEPAWDFAIELGLDYKVRARQPMLVPNIGASIGYKRLSIHAEAGLEFGEILQPYYGAGVRFKLLK